MGRLPFSQRLTLNEGMTGSLQILTTRVIYARMNVSAVFKLVLGCRADDDKKNPSAGNNHLNAEYRMTKKKNLQKWF